MKKITPDQFVPFVPPARVDPKKEKTQEGEDIDAETRNSPRELSRNPIVGDVYESVFTTAMIELPIVEELPLNLQVARHIDINLSRSEGVTLRRLLIGAQDGPRPVKLRTGRFVQNSADVVRLFLEKAGGEK